MKLQKCQSELLGKSVVNLSASAWAAGSGNLNFSRTRSSQMAAFVGFSPARMVFTVDSDGVHCSILIAAIAMASWPGADQQYAVDGKMEMIEQAKNRAFIYEVYVTVLGLV